jgi:hypothetical protein
LVDYLEKGATSTANYYTSLSEKVKQALVSKQQGMLSRRGYFQPLMMPCLLQHSIWLI